MVRTRRRCRLRRKTCPDCGARAVVVRYEHVAAARATVAPPLEIRCTNQGCPRYWQ